MAQLKGANVKLLPAAPPAQAPVQAVPAPKVEPKIVEWTLECSHHAKSGGRALLERGQRVDVVPDKGKKSEKITVTYRNDAIAVPAALKASGVSIPKSGGDAHRGKYAFDAEFKGDLDARHFYKAEFWRAYRQITPYTIEDGPAPIQVNVHCPRQYRFELKLPKLRSYEVGDKYSLKTLRTGDGEKHLASVRDEHKHKDARWSGSKIVKTEETEKLGKAPESKTEREDALPEGYELKIDGQKVTLEVAALLGPVVAFTEALKKITQAFDEAPKVGWYFKAQLGVLEGALVSEWQWKEHTDHRVFEYVDVFIELSVVSAKLEIGIGVSGLGFKAQAYASIDGEITLKLSACREHPDMPRTLNAPVKGEITGKIGARFEAGNFLKLDANGKTGLEVQADFALNRPDRSGPVTVDLSWEWTGIEVTATASLGAEGIGGEETTWKKTLAKRKELGKHRWPDDKEYAPPRVSRDRIRQVLLETFTKGLDVKIAVVERGRFLPNSYMDLDRAADTLADHIDPHPTFDRSPEAVEGLAAGIRRDFENIAGRRGFISEREFDAYLGGRLQDRLRAMVPPAADLLKAKPSGGASSSR